MDVVFHCLIYLSFIALISCQSEPFQCHICRSDINQECADEFQGKDDRFLKACNFTGVTKNTKMFCRKEVNNAMTNTPTQYYRYCYSTDGYTPEDEYDAYGTDYYTCTSPGCNGQSSVKFGVSVLGLAVMLQKVFTMF